MDVPVCCLSEPLEEKMPTEFVPAHVIRKRFFSAKTKKERNYWVFVYATQGGLFSNMEDDEKPKAIQAREWYKI
jgi:hypothetical protein